MRAGPGEAAPPGGGRLAGLPRALLLLFGLTGAGLLLRQLPHGADAELLDRFVAGRGAAGQAVFVAVAAAACAAGLPRQLAAFAGGYAFGAAWGAALAMAAQLLGCAAAFGWARALGRDWAARRMPARMRRVHDLIARKPFSATLTLRLLPVGNNLLLNLLAGLSAVPPASFLAASALGYLPQTIVFALLGAGTQVGRAAQIAIGVALFAASAALGYALLRRQRSETV